MPVGPAGQYTLEVPADENENWPVVTGPEGTKELVREGFFEMFEDGPEPTQGEIVLLEPYLDGFFVAESAV